MNEAEAVESLSAQAAARPGDPVVRARLAVARAALAEASGAGADGATEAVIDEALQLARTCLELGIGEPAYEAASILYERFAGARFASAELATEIALLMADAALQREGGQEIERARRLLEAAVAARPDALGARTRAAALALGLGELDAARRWIEPVARRTSDTWTLYVQLLLAEGAADEAANEARLATERAPEVSVLHQLLGIAELTRGELDLAIEALSEGLRLAPEDPVAYYNLALAFEASGSRAAALGVTDAGLELAPADPRLRALKARLAT